MDVRVVRGQKGTANHANHANKISLGWRNGGAHAPSRVVSSALAGNIGRAERDSTGASNPTAGGGCAPHSKTGTGALPGNVPVGGRAPWWPSARTQWQFGVDERGEHTRPRVWLPAPSLETSGGRKGVRRGRQTRQPGAAVLPSKDPMGGRPQGRCRPAGAEIYFDFFWGLCFESRHTTIEAYSPLTTTT